MNETYLCDTAQLVWQRGVPYSKHYKDIYWHHSGALQEKQHVFIKPLEQQLAKCNVREHITVCELGFGFGINCLLLAEFWSSRYKSSRLNIVSIENQPIAKIELKKYLNRLNLTHTENLINQYPLPYRGLHVIWLADNIRLLLLLNDAETALSGLDAKVDFWFLDGFAPSLNREMWKASLYRKMYSRSRPGASVATYTAAGYVRRGLEGAGFVTKKMPGFAGKKEMVRAKVPGEWRKPTPPDYSVTIVGAGLAGLYCYEALQRRGISTRIIDSETRTSQIPQFTVKPQLAVRAEARYRYSVMAFQYMKGSPGYYHTGLKQYASTAKERARIHKISDQFPDSIMSSGSDGTFDLHEAGWLSLKSLRNTLTPKITRDEVLEVRSFSGRWFLIGRKKEYEANQVIIATGGNRGLLPLELQIRAIHGQAVSIDTENIRQILNGDVSILPTYEGRSIVTGTYDRRDSLEANPEDTKTLIESAHKLVCSAPQNVQVYTGIRAVTRDRLPVIGEAPDFEKLIDIKRFRDIRESLNGLYYCTAFGSRGATHARLSAEHLVSKMFDEPAALELKQQEMLSPARFALRDRF